MTRLCPVPLWRVLAIALAVLIAAMGGCSLLTGVALDRLTGFLMLVAGIGAAWAVAKGYTP